MLIFRYTYSIFDGDSKVTLTITLFLLGDSNITTPCPLHLLEQIMAKQSIMVTHSMPIYSGDRDTRGEEAVAQNPQNGLATKRSRAIDLSCRACDASAGAGAKTSNSELDFPVGEPSVLLPQPPILLAEKSPLQKWSILYLWEYFLAPEHRIPIWVDFELGLRIPDVIKVTQR